MRYIGRPLSRTTRVGQKYGKWIEARQRMERSEEARAMERKGGRKRKEAGHWGGLQ